MQNVPPTGTTQRLDEALVARELFATRSRARDAVKRSTVSVNGRIETKPGRLVAGRDELTTDDAARRYVSRAALKLVAGLDHFGLDVDGAVALDIGASTGGFVQVLLERGARDVFAVDVGHGQMHDKLLGDPRVTNLEGLNARELKAAHLDGAAPDIVVSDVSFISLKLALPPALQLAAPGAAAVLLVKPQFEAGRSAIGKGGILRNATDGPRIADDLAAWLGGQDGWQTIGWTPSPIEGGDGNREFVLAGVKDR
ncbi:TlyA family RNA methyltransferase [Mesorhizobium xinjiangense]|uniref:TlyA family RNA methyltransferase n=1 Tax=Mesorhizobium xinjiangense TaxID=2678685 RepID=UPI0012ECFADF|nr:TlyA family RNA methyltransferase [Mesorhizobium xinjiangense]